MNIRCAFCQTPYTLSRNELLFALQKIDSEKLNHYDAHCPRCRRATQLPRQRLEMAFPNWRQALQEAASAPVAETPPAAPIPPQSVSIETSVTEPIKKAEPAPAKIQPVKPVEVVVKKIAEKTKAAPAKPAKKPVPAKATASKAKPAASKKTPAKPAASKAKKTGKK
jgi:outer membrane biosynthesis protein TonB